MKMEQTWCFLTSANKIQTPGNYPKERIEHSEQGECLKSRVVEKLDVHKSVHHDTTMKITNKMHYID
jgi:hypothetical protein